MRCLNVLDSIRVILSLIMLGYASWVDIKTREVHDILWLIFGAVGLGLAIYEIYVGSLSLVWFITAVFISALISLGLGYFGLFGGADVAAFIVLAILHPVAPILVEPLLGVVSPLFPLTIFSNSALCGGSLSFYIVARNLLAKLHGERLFLGLEHEPIWKRIIVSFTGIRMDIGSVRGPPFQYPLEILTTDNGPNRRLILMPEISDDDSAQATFKQLEKAGFEKVWVSSTIPFIVSITIGYLGAILLGDVVLRFLIPLFLALS